MVDPLTWEFELRPGVRFHDGAPLTAADVVWSFARIAAVAPAPQLALQLVQVDQRGLAPRVPRARGLTAHRPPRLQARVP